jgi:hypothetical protein
MPPFDKAAMMPGSVTKRAALTGACAAFGAMTLIAFRPRSGDLAFYDSRIPESQIFADAMRRASAIPVDVVDQEALQWCVVRAKGLSGSLHGDDALVRMDHFARCIMGERRVGADRRAHALRRLSRRVRMGNASLRAFVRAGGRIADLERLL